MEWFIKAFGIAFGVGLGWVAAPFVILALIFLSTIGFLIVCAILERIGDMWSEFRYRFFPTQHQKLLKERRASLPRPIA